MVHIRIGVPRGTWIEVPARAREIGRVAPADCVDVHAVRSRRHPLKVEYDLNEASIGDLIFVQLDRAGDFLALNLGRRGLKVRMRGKLVFYG